MSIFEDTNPRALRELLEQIHSREAALPDFQRDLVWDAAETQELIASIASEFPAGSLLRVRNTYDLFAPREFQGAPPLDGHKPTYLVLDGQQRLTSLYQAFYGVGDHRYYLDLRQLIDGADFEDAVFHVRANSREARSYDDFEKQARDLVMPLGVLKKGASEFFRWAHEVGKVASTTLPSDVEEKLHVLWKKWIQTIDDYKFPVVTLADTTTADAICTIFETLNRTGVKLTVFELLTARFYPKGVKLRDLWAKAVNDQPIIAEFAIDPYYLLQIVSMIVREHPSCKRSDVLNLSASAINQWWLPAAEALTKTLRILRDDCGVLIPDWLPYDTVLVPFAAVLAKLGAVKGADAGANREKLTQWFWCSVFSQAYDNAANSQAARDMTELLVWLGGGKPPQTVSEFAFDPSVLRRTTPRQRALYRGAICLILRLGPADFYNGENLTGELIRQRKVDDHHVFPRNYLAGLGVAEPLRDCVLNRTLIDRQTNQSIQDRPPSTYFAEIRGKLNTGFKKLLESHLLPSGDTSALMSDQFEQFLDWRQDAMWAQIEAATGLADRVEHS
jgi:hypothetical protein